MRTALKVSNDGEGLLRLLQSLGALPEDRVFFLTEPQIRKVAERLNLSPEGDIEAIAVQLTSHGLEAFTEIGPFSTPATTTVDVPATWTFQDGQLTESPDEVRDYLREEITKEIVEEWSATHFSGDLLHTPNVVILSWQIHGSKNKYVEVQYSIV